MAAPAKAYVQPTGASSIPLGLNLPIQIRYRIATGPGSGGIAVSGANWGNPMLTVNKFRAGYGFVMVCTARMGPYGTAPTNKVAWIAQVSSSIATMLTNTFPAAYTVKQVRPNFGQLYPRNARWI